MKKASFAFLGIGVSLLMGVASAGNDTSYDDPRIGKKVDRICFARSIDNFKIPDDFDDAVLLEKGVNDWFFVELRGACASRSLRFAQAIGIDTFGGGGCLTRGDTLIFSSSAFKPKPHDLSRCFVDDMYKWDEDAVEEEEESDEDVET